MNAASTAGDLAKEAAELFHFWERLYVEVGRGTQNSHEGTRLQKAINDATWSVRTTVTRIQSEADRSDPREVRVADAGVRVGQVFAAFLNNRGGGTEGLREAMAELDDARRQLARRPAGTGDTVGSSGRTEMPTSARVTVQGESSKGFDVFISHAWEDKEAVARPLYDALTDRGISVWFDEAELTLGDSLRRKIDEGLATCRFGVVILSPRFLQKQWPQRELDGLVARETATGAKTILPIWHEIDGPTLATYSPVLADRLAGRSDVGIPALVDQIRRALER